MAEHPTLPTRDNQPASAKPAVPRRGTPAATSRTGGGRKKKHAAVGGRIAVTGISLSAGLLMVGGMAASAKNATKTTQPAPVITRRVVVVPAPNAVPAVTPQATFPTQTVAPAPVITLTPGDAGVAPATTAAPAAAAPQATVAPQPAAPATTAAPVATTPPAPPTTRQAPPPPTTVSAGS